jgi:hypothetical protein
MYIGSPKTKSMPKLPPPTPFNNPKEIFINGEPFYLAAHLLYLQVIELQKNNQPFIETMKASFANHALAVEIYLKCLQCLDHKEYYPIHPLDQLFNTLHPDTKAKIISNFETLSANNIMTQMIIKAIGPLKKFDFETLLTEASKAFENFRYSFDRKTESYQMEDIANAIRRTILESHSDWPTLMPL